MNEVLIYVALVLFGVTFGSFAGAMVWRLRARQLQNDKNQGEKVDSKEYSRLKKLTKTSVLKDRSCCLHCGYELKWYDLLPVISWLSLKGRCRKCKKRIGWFELLIELGVALFFVLSYAFWPQALGTGVEIAHFILWLAAGVIMAILFAYDVKWFLLPDKVSLLLALVGLAIVVLSAVETQDYLATGLTALGSVAVLSGLYLLIYILSKGKWIGFGDVKLGVGLGLIIIDWQLAIMALFLANFIGTLIVAPLLVSRKIKRSAHIPFGPLLITGTVVAWFVGWPILNWYLGLLGV